MTLKWLKKSVVLTTLCALVFLRLVDLAVFDQEHDHVSGLHIEVFASEMVHAHGHDEASEHNSSDGKSLHIAFHTLVNVFLEAVSDKDMLSADMSSHFSFQITKVARTRISRPPVPPPLA